MIPESREKNVLRKYSSSAAYYAVADGLVVFKPSTSSVRSYFNSHSWNMEKVLCCALSIVLLFCMVVT